MGNIFANGNFNPIKFVVIVILLIFFSYYWNQQKEKTNNAFSSLINMDLVGLEVRGEFDSIRGSAIKRITNRERLIQIEKCLDKMKEINDYRFGENLKWGLISFIGDNYVHHIKFAHLRNGKVLMGTKYILESKKPVTKENVGFGNGRSSECLYDLIKK